MGLHPCPSLDHLGHPSLAQVPRRATVNGLNAPAQAGTAALVAAVAVMAWDAIALAPRGRRIASPSQPVGRDLAGCSAFRRRGTPAVGDRDG